MPAKSKAQQFVLLPSRGLHGGIAHTPHSNKFFQNMHAAHTSRDKMMDIAGTKRKGAMRVIDSIHEEGAKLIEIDPGELVHLRAAQPGVRITPLTWYSPMLEQRHVINANAKAAAGAAKVRVRLVSNANGTPVAQARIDAFTDFVRKKGANGITNSNGYVNLSLGAKSRKIERLYIRPYAGFWGVFRKNLTLKTGQEFKLRSIDLPYKDALRHFYGTAALNAGSGVTVGVVDTGIGPHPDLVVAGGANTVTGENPNDFSDNGAKHGSHVGGIIAGRGKMRGMAPNVKLRSYRVYGKNAKAASNFSIASAIDRAITDGCDLINLSIGGVEDPAITDAIELAFASGSLVFVAAGNAGRQPVGFPATLSSAQAISALGRKGTFPPGTPTSDQVLAPYGKSKHNFVTRESDVGPEIDLIAPGAGIISTVPGGYAAMDGTSMACPAATGAFASILARAGKVLKMPRDAQRSEAMKRLFAQHTKDMGFAAKYQGGGMLF